MMLENKIRIAVADDRPVVLCGLQSWFESHARFRVISCARNASQLLAGLDTAACDLIVLGCDTKAARADDFALLRQLRRVFPDTPLIALTDETDALALAPIQDCGAAGLVSSRDEAQAFERVCERVLSGARTVVSPCIVALLSPPAPGGSAGPDYRGTSLSVTQFVARPLDTAI